MRILVVGHHQDTLDGLIEYLRLEGHLVKRAYDGLTGLNLAVTGTFEALLLDTKAHGIDGNQICHALRTHTKSEISIVMLSSCQGLEHCLASFAVGADDFIASPVASAEVLARLRAVVSRRTRCGNRVLKVDELSFDLDTFEVRRERHALRLNLTGLKLLEVFMRRSPAIVSRLELQKAIWGRDVPSSDSLRSNIHLLRQALDKDFNSPLLHTIPGVGYRLAAVR